MSLLTSLRSLVLTLLLLAYPKAKIDQIPTKDIARSEDALRDMLFAFERIGVSEVEKAKLAPIVIVWSYYESNWFASPTGNNDQGQACGVMQVHQPWIEIAGATCDTVRRDRILGYEIGIMRLRGFIAKCGSIRGGLTAFSMRGECPKTPGWTIKLVVDRCKIAGC